MASGTLSSTPGPANSSSQSSNPLTWEGDKMFNIYIYDYCNKRGFHETAQKLMIEAEIPLESQPPINAKQGLLFEWWSVFWVLFTAKSSGQGTDDAMLYIQHQTQQQAARQAQARIQNQNQPMNRMGAMNGFQRPGGAGPPGPMTNGTGPASLQGAQGPMNGTPGSASFPMSGPPHQQNGIPGTPAGPPAPASAPPQSGNYSTMLMNPRTGAPQQRGPASGPQFGQSPTMAHSPQANGGAPGQQPPPMSQLGPSPHLQHMPRGGNMMPPNGVQGPPQGNNPAFHNPQRPPSRTASPGNMPPQQSPSMTARQPPGSAQEAGINNEIARLHAPLVNVCKQELGMGNRDLNTFSLEEKGRVLQLARQKMMQKPPMGTQNAAAGPSMQMQNQPRPGTAPQRGNKRNSTSPGEEHETLPRNESSPPDRKRPRRSPLNAEQAPPMTTMNFGQQPPQGGVQGGPPQMSNGPMRPMGAPAMNGFNQATMQSMAMGNSPSMMGMGQPMQQPGNAQIQHYRASMQAAHQKPMGGNAGSPGSNDPPFGGPQGAGSQFNNGGAVANNRMNQNKPTNMMPPPSPANGSQKDGKDKNGRPDASPRNQPANPGQPPNSGQFGQGGTAPPTPNNMPATAPSPSAMLGGPPPGLSQPPQSMAATDMTAIFGNNDFMNSIPTLDGFQDADLGKAINDVDFERDFGEWFNPGNDFTTT